MNRTFLPEKLENFLFHINKLSKQELEELLQRYKSYTPIDVIDQNELEIQIYYIEEQLKNKNEPSSFRNLNIEVDNIRTV